MLLTSRKPNRQRVLFLQTGLNGTHAQFFEFLDSVIPGILIFDDAVGSSQVGIEFGTVS